MSRAFRRCKHAMQRFCQAQAELLFAARQLAATPAHVHEVHNAALSLLAAQRALVEAHTPPSDADVLDAGEGVL